MFVDTVETLLARKGSGSPVLIYLQLHADGRLIPCRQMHLDISYQNRKGHERTPHVLQFGLAAVHSSKAALAHTWMGGTQRRKLTAYLRCSRPPYFPSVPTVEGDTPNPPHTHELTNASTGLRLHALASLPSHSRRPDKKPKSTRFLQHPTSIQNASSEMSEYNGNTYRKIGQ